MIQRLRSHPLLRALRPDKFTLAALEATLRLYLDEGQALGQIPTLFLLTRPLSELERQARTLARALKRRFGERLTAQRLPSVARVGGGALPQEDLPSVALALSFPPLTAHQLEARLRRTEPPVIGRVEQDRLLLDMRTLRADDLPPLLAALEQVAAGLAPESQP